MSTRQLARIKPKVFHLPPPPIAYNLPTAVDAQLDLIMYHGFITDGADNHQHLAMAKSVPELATLTVVEDANYSSLTQLHVRKTPCVTNTCAGTTSVLTNAHDQNHIYEMKTPPPSD